MVEIEVPHRWGMHSKTGPSHLFPRISHKNKAIIEKKKKEVCRYFGSVIGYCVGFGSFSVNKFQLNRPSTAPAKRKATPAKTAKVTSTY